MENFDDGELLTSANGEEAIEDINGIDEPEDVKDNDVVSVFGVVKLLIPIIGEPNIDVVDAVTALTVATIDDEDKVDETVNVFVEIAVAVAVDILVEVPDDMIVDSVVDNVVGFTVDSADVEITGETVAEVAVETTVETLVETFVDSVVDAVVDEVVATAITNGLSSSDFTSLSKITSLVSSDCCFSGELTVVTSISSISDPEAEGVDVWMLMLFTTVFKVSSPKVDLVSLLGTTSLLFAVFVDDLGENDFGENDFGEKEVPASFLSLVLAPVDGTGYTDAPPV